MISIKEGKKENLVEKENGRKKLMGIGEGGWWYN